MWLWSNSQKGHARYSNCFSGDFSAVSKIWDGVDMELVTIMHSGHALDILICVKSYIYRNYCVGGLGWTKIWTDTPTNHLSTDRVQGGCCSLCLHLWQAGACSSMVAISFSQVGPRRKRMQLLLSLLLLPLITKVRCLLCGIRLCTSGWNVWCWFWPSLLVLLL
jgi:hypothetical protein